MALQWLLTLDHILTSTVCLVMGMWMLLYFSDGPDAPPDAPTWRLFKLGFRILEPPRTCCGDMMAEQHGGVCQTPGQATSEVQPLQPLWNVCRHTNVMQLHIPAGQLTPLINSRAPTSYITWTAISGGTLNLHASSFPRPLAAISFCLSPSWDVCTDVYIIFQTKHEPLVLFQIEECTLMRPPHLCVAASACCSVQHLR